MEEKKMNRREAYTLRVIREAFISLLIKKSVEKISVGELCELADVNRSTFYRHYADVYALLDEISEEYFRLLFSDTIHADDRRGNFAEMGYNLILKALSVTEENREMYLMLLDKQPAAWFQKRLHDAAVELFLSNAKQISAETSLHYQYLISGILGIWQAWLRSGCELSQKQVAEIVLIHLGGVEQVVSDRGMQNRKTPRK